MISAVEHPVDWREKPAKPGNPPKPREPAKPGNPRNPREPAGTRETRERFRGNPQKVSREPRNLGNLRSQENPFQKGVSEEEEGKAKNQCRNVKTGLATAVVSRTDAYTWHCSHFGSRYKLGCCGTAGLFYARLGSNLPPPVHKLVI